MESYFAKLFSHLKLIIRFCITYSSRQASGHINPQHPRCRTGTKRRQRNNQPIGTNNQSKFINLIRIAYEQDSYFIGSIAGGLGSMGTTLSKSKRHEAFRQQPNTPRGKKMAHNAKKTNLLIPDWKRNAAKPAKVRKAAGDGPLITARNSYTLPPTTTLRA